MKWNDELQLLISADLPWQAKVEYARARWSVTRWGKAAYPRDHSHKVKVGSGEEAFLRSGSTDVLAFREIFLENTYESALSTVPGEGRHCRVMDCGANVGLFSLLCAKCFDHPSLLCVEPSEANLKWLHINVANLRADVTTVQAFVGEGDGFGYLRDTGCGEWGFSLSRIPVAGASSIPILDIPSLMKQIGWDGIDLLKVDIEGAEREVFANSESWIDLVNTIIVELHSGYSLNDFASDISQANREWQITRHLEYGDQILCSARRRYHH